MNASAPAMAQPGMAQVAALVRSAAPLPAPAGPRRGLIAHSLEDFMTLELPERRCLLDPVIPKQGLVMLFAPRGVGKTYAALTMSHAVASGGQAFGWRADQPQKVLYLDGEMPASLMQERLAQITAGSERQPPSGNFAIFNPDLNPEAVMPNLATPDGQEAVEPLLDGVSLVVVDNLATLARFGRENEAESWLPVQSWLLGQRRQGRSVLIVHHAGKNNSQRGTSAHEDVLDVVIKLGRPEDYRPSEGARFIVELTKARSIFGQAAAPFEASLIAQADGGLRWEVRDIADQRLTQVLEGKRQGKSVREIADQTGVSKSTVQRMLKNMEATN